MRAIGAAAGGGVGGARGTDAEPYVCMGAGSLLCASATSAATSPGVSDSSAPEPESPSD